MVYALKEQPVRSDTYLGGYKLLDDLSSFE